MRPPEASVVIPTFQAGDTAQTQTSATIKPTYALVSTGLRSSEDVSRSV